MAAPSIVHIGTDILPMSPRPKALQRSSQNQPAIAPAIAPSLAPRSQPRMPPRIPPSIAPIPALKNLSFNAPINLLTKSLATPEK